MYELDNNMKLRLLFFSLTIISFSFLSLNAEAKVLQDVNCQSQKNRRSEVAFVITGWVKSSDVDSLARCLKKQEHRLTTSHSLNPINWQSKRLKELDDCNLKRCVYNIPKWAVSELMKGKSIEEKKQIYYQLIHKLSFGLAKKTKKDRIRAYQLRNEICGHHDLFHWLLNGPPKSTDYLIWRKHYGKKMRPTIRTIQVSQWKEGEHHCIGYTHLFADHYYYDGLDLLQLTPKEEDRVEFRFVVRERYDIFNEWWARRFRGKVRKRIKNRKLEILKKRFNACVSSE